jgi:ABC-type multidrug transport system fused ATPase/permease subunit
VSLTRISSFLLKEEINEHDITHKNTPGVAIQVEEVDLGWSHDAAFLTRLSMEVRAGKLVAIVGPVGSGKSSLVSGLLGEMHKLNNGSINVNGQTAYVPQQAWIQNQTLKNNIIFKLGRRVNEHRYKRILEACSLISDLKIMPAGENTEIGEKGINLSGGQKQRISLARAVYADADIYMLDDPLSAVDSHVGKHIFDHVIGPNGMLKNKTRVFVTNSLSFLPQADEVIMLENGTIAEIGTYDELVHRKDGAFSQFMKNFLENNAANKGYLA